MQKVVSKHVVREEMFHYLPDIEEAILKRISSEMGNVMYENKMFDITREQRAFSSSIGYTMEGYIISKADVMEIRSLIEQLGYNSPPIVKTHLINKLKKLLEL